MILVVIMIFIVSIQVSCKKEYVPKVAVKIEYLGDGGFYNDNIDNVPSGLSLGLNGPYPLDITKTYTMQYKAGKNWGTITRTWKPVSGYWTIRCFLEGNTAYMLTIPGTN